MTRVDFAFQVGGITMIIVGLGLGLIGYLRLGSASGITGLGDLLNTFFATLLVAPFLITWGTMILGIGWIAEASRKETEVIEEPEENSKGK